MSGYETIKTLPEYDRPYEKIEQYGANSLTDSELLAVIIRSGTKNKNCLEVSRACLNLFNGSLSDVFAGGIGELTQIEGVGISKAILIKAVDEIAVRISRDRFKKVKIAVTPDSVGNMLIGDIGYMENEVFRVIMIDKGLHIIGSKNVSSGILDSTVVHPREVFSPAIKNLAYGIIVAHNHPGGRKEPSRDDIALTDRIIEAGNLLGIKVFDHFIVTKNEYFSMAENKVGKFA